MTQHRVFVTQSSRTIGVTPSVKSFIRRVARAALSSEGVHDPCEVNVLVACDDTIREINRAQRQMDKPTDVLSFPYLSLQPGEKPTAGTGDADLHTGRILLGDIVLSLPTAARQAEQYGHTLEREVGFLTVHAMLHLLGYDHEEDDTLMRAKQEQILHSLDLRR